MNAEQYNQSAVGHIWALNDLPDPWPGKKVLLKGDIDGDLWLDPEEMHIPDWPLFSDHVRTFQKAALLKFDGKLGPATFGALLEKYYHVQEPEKILGWFGNLVMKRSECPTAPPANPTAHGDNPLKRRIASLWNFYGGAIQTAADKLDLPVQAALSVFSVESGRAYDPKTGLLIVRFENKTVWRKKYGQPGVRNDHSSQAAEWTALSKASQINLEKSVMASSWGLGQIMGFHYKLLGYDDPVNMVQWFQHDVRHQVNAFFRFCREQGLALVIKNQDWPKFVRAYNGARPDSGKAWVREIYQNYTKGLAAAYKAIEEMKDHNIL